VHDEKTCSRCQGAMSAGFVLDKIDDARARQSDWQEGNSKRNFWTGVKLHADLQRPITTFRCERCGYLESYAI
jgi:hypothetical protein